MSRREELATEIAGIVFMLGMVFLLCSISAQVFQITVWQAMIPFLLVLGIFVLMFIVWLVCWMIMMREIKEDED